ncbi:MAG: hypothetical protein JEZ09_03350 [Salinivirgaceae bacterium]|nr:hypothetical protein [Salinivirgaceae bacterium]
MKQDKIITCTMKRIVYIFILFNLLANQLKAQDKLTINGYISTVGQSIMIKDSADNLDAQSDLIIHNRINITYYPNDKITGHLEFRNQFVVGEMAKNTPNYAKQFSKDKGMVDLNWNWFECDNNLLNTQIDRAYLEYVNGKLELSLGRQRINWGRTLVWNPNDLFNAYSYYDFDYMEKPGADALRALYYTGMASSVEIVAKMDSAENLTLAGLTKLNNWGYDFQILAGYVNSEDYIIGGGWEGNIKSFAFRGEMSYYQPEKNFADTSGVFLFSVGADYAFENSMMVQFEFLYNDNKVLNSPLELFSGAPQNSKSLSFSETNYFGNISYPILPILTVNFAGMYFHDYKGYFLMPGVDVSLKDNLVFTTSAQYFNLEFENPYTGVSSRVGTTIAFARLKWNF